MKTIASRFFATGAIFALCGMVWGIVMSATQDHTLSPAHGHLNLIGFVAMSVFGAYYALNPAAGATRLAAVHYGLTTLAVATIVPGIVLAITDRGETLAQAGSVAALLSMALFALTVIRHGLSSDRPNAPAQPAE